MIKISAEINEIETKKKKETTKQIKIKKNTKN
jgi:hypothetical protein